MTYYSFRVNYNSSGEKTVTLTYLLLICFDVAWIGGEGGVAGAAFFFFLLQIINYSSNKKPEHIFRYAVSLQRTNLPSHLFRLQINKPSNNQKSLDTRYSSKLPRPSCPYFFPPLSLGLSTCPPLGLLHTYILRIWRSL